MQISATSCDTCRPEKNPQDSLCSESDLQVLLGFRQWIRMNVRDYLLLAIWLLVFHQEENIKIFNWFRV